MISRRLEAVTVRWKRALTVGLALAVLAVLAVAPSALAKGGMGANVQLKLVDQIVAAGSHVDLVAIVRPVEVGSKVSLYRAEGDADWQLVATKTLVSPSGRVSFSDLVTRHTSYRAKWVFADGSVLWSRVAWQRVQAALTVHAAPAPYQQGTGTPVAISGTLVPDWSGHDVSIQIFRLEGDGQMLVARLSATLTPSAGDSSVYAATWNAMSPGDYVIRAQVKRASYFFGTWVTTDLTL